MTPPTALVTGASRGLGAALAEALNRRGWRLVVDGRDPDRLAAGVAALPRPDLVTAVAGDVADPAHRAALAAAVPGRLELLVNNASELGPTPRPIPARPGCRSRRPSSRHCCGWSTRIFPEVVTAWPT